MRKLICTVTAIALISSVLATFGSAGVGALAGEHAESTIKYRRAVMKSLSGHIGAAFQIIKGSAPYDDELKIHANSLNAMLKDLAAYFPEGSGIGKTNAKPEIWNDLKAFNALAVSNKKAGAEFAAAVSSGDKAGIARTANTLLQSCKDCHKDYRVKKN